MTHITENAVKPLLVGEVCPTCGNEANYSHTPLYISLSVLALIVVLLGVMFVKLLLSKREAQTCMKMRSKSQTASSRD
jgi:hypothetical protein